MGPKWHFTTIWLLLCLGTGAWAGPGSSSVRAKMDRLRAQGRERVIILYETGRTADWAGETAVRHVRRLALTNADICEIPSSRIEAIRSRPGVRDVIVDEPVRLAPSRFTQAALSGAEGSVSLGGVTRIPWNLDPPGLNASAVWARYGLDGSGVKVAFIDSGVNYTLSDTDRNYLGGIDYVGDDDDPFTNNAMEYHGTMVVSIGVGEGQVRIIGAAPGAGYYVARVTDESFIALISDIVSAVEWALDPDGDPQTDDGADVISMSLGTYGGGNGWTQLKQQWEALCQQAFSRGVVVLAASGNDGRTTSAYPAVFSSVISVGAHDEAQNVWNNTFNASNGGVDVVAPGANIIGMQAGGLPSLGEGTSFAVPHVSGLMALQIQYARESALAVNAGYHWEILKHSAVDLGYTSLWQGSGKAYAAATDANDAHTGAIDLMAAGWPVLCDVQFHDYAFMHDGEAVYRPGETFNQDLVLTNITDQTGNRSETIQNLSVESRQLSDPNGPALPGDSNGVWPIITSLAPGQASARTLNYTWTVATDTLPTTASTSVRLRFKFQNGTRTLDIARTVADSRWRVAHRGDLNLDSRVDFRDLALAVAHWGRADCASANNCDGADIDLSGSVDAGDLHALSTYWLVGVD